MKAYFLFENLELLDAARMEEYREKVFPLVAKYQGTYIVVDNQPKTLEGEWRPSFLVMIEFPSRELAEAWYKSEDYAPLKALRQSAMRNNGVLMQGLPV